MSRLVAIALLVAACRAPGRAPEADGGADLVLRGVKARHFEDGRLASRSTADELRLGRKAGRVDLASPKSVDEEDRRELESGRGTLDLRAGRLHLDDGVTLREPGEATVEAPSADVDLRTRTATGPSVVVHDDGLTTRADRFTAEGGASRLELRGNVRTTVDDGGGRR